MHSVVAELDESIFQGGLVGQKEYQNMTRRHIVELSRPWSFAVQDWCLCSSLRRSRFAYIISGPWEIYQNMDYLDRSISILRAEFAASYISNNPS